MAAAMKKERENVVIDEDKYAIKMEREVAERLLEEVGKPEGFVSVKAHVVNRTWFRVNIRTLNGKHNGMIALTKIAHSYFVQYRDGKFVDGDKVEKLYQD